jgi:hypothetical protein
MNHEPEAPQWMKDMFSELSVMFEELFPDHEEPLFSGSDNGGS